MAAVSELFVAIGLILALEGGLYAAFPGAMKRMMVVVLQQPDESLRMLGLGAATAGVAIVWLVRNVTG